MVSNADVDVAKEHKEEEADVLGTPPMKRTNSLDVSNSVVESSPPSTHPQQPPPKRLNLVSLMLGRCTGMCAAFPAGGGMGSPSSSMQFVELQGLQFIGLGAVTDELSPKERVYDTLEQLTTRTERLVSIGYLLDPPLDTQPDGSPQENSADYSRTKTVPLDVWNKNNTDPNSLSKQVQSIVEMTTTNQFKQLKEAFTRQLRAQKGRPNKNNNKYLAGITAHNLGVLAALMRKPDEAIAYFREAICLKEAAFGRHDREVASSWDELGIQFFARGDFDGALTSFREAHSVRNIVRVGSVVSTFSNTSTGSTSHPSVAMVLNNMACCYFQMGDYHKALETLEEADQIQQKAIGSSAQAELDLLHFAVVVGNCGYLKLALKKYDEARSLLEEALLIQQSVLDDNHRAVRDTLSNIAFANAFHS